MANGSRKSFGGSRRVTIPSGQGFGQTRRLGRSGTITTATPQQVREFQREQAERMTQAPIPRETQRQIERAGQALNDPDLPKRVSMRQQSETVQTGKSGTLQRKQPDPELFIDDASVRADVEAAFKGVPGSDEFIPGDAGTEIVLSEVRRRASERGLSDKQVLGTTQQLAEKAGLQGFKAKKSPMGAILSSKTLGIPNVLLAVMSAGIANAATAGSAAAGTPASQQAAGQSVFSTPGTNFPVAVPSKLAGTGVTSGLTPLSTATAGATAATTRGGLESAKAAGKIGKASSLSVGKIAKNALRGAQLVDQLGGRGGTTGGPSSGATLGPAQTLQVFFAQPQAQQPRQRTVAGATAAPFRNLRDKFGGTATASLFRPRRERFGARRRGSTLGA